MKEGITKQNISSIITNQHEKLNNNVIITMPSLDDNITNNFKRAYCKLEGGLTKNTNLRLNA